MKAQLIKFSIFLIIFPLHHLFAQFSGAGAGTSVDPYIITTPTQLREMADDLTASYMLGNDINLKIATANAAGEFYNEGKGWDPLEEFTGSLDGNTRKIIGLYINRPDESEIGLISRTGTGSEIKAVRMEDVDITGNLQVGSLVGWNRLGGSIARCVATGIINGTVAVGGLAGENWNGIISESYTNVLVKSLGNSEDNDFSGGIVGILSGGTINDCYTLGSVRGTNNKVGGIAGANLENGIITNTYALGYIYGTGETGAILGVNTSGTVTNSYFHLFGTNQTVGIGAGAVTTGTTGLDNTQIVQEASFAGFDFSSTWNITESQTSPSLQLNPPTTLPEPNLGPFLVGAGTEVDPWQITTAEQLNAIRDQKLQGQSSYFTGHYVLMNDLDLSTATGDPSGDYWNDGKGWKPLGDNNSTQPEEFIGLFDGNGKTITGLTINRPEQNNIGLFARLGRFSSDNGMVESLHLVNVNITGGNSTGAIVGSGGESGTSVTVKNSSVTGNLVGGSFVGGLVGSSVILERSSSSADVTGINQIGGLVGRSKGVVECFSTGTVTGNSAVGGLIGFAPDFYTVRDSYSTASVIADTEGTSAGGLIGVMTPNSSFTLYSYATGTVQLGDGSYGNGALGRISQAISGSNVLSVYFDWSSCNRLESFSPAQGLTSSEMVFETSFVNYDFGPEGAWAIDEGTSYPYLKWQGSAQIFNLPPSAIEDPTPNAPTLADVTAQCSVDQVPDAPTATDACGKTISGTTDAAFPFEGPGTYEITWTFSTINGETATQTQNIVIADTEAPVPDAVTLDTVRSTCSVGNINAPLATDACEGEITGTTNTTFPIAVQDTTRVTWIYTDSLGNESTQEQLVIIIDSVAPNPHLATLPDFQGSCDSDITLDQISIPSAGDNCTGSREGVPDVNFPITAPGETIVTWTFDDGNGNTATQLQTFIIPTANESISDTAICENAEFIFPDGTPWDGVTLNQISTLQNQQGCDSVVTTNLTVLPLPEVDLGPEEIFACVGEELAFGIDESNTEFTAYTISGLRGEAIDDSLKFIFDEELAVIAATQGAFVTIELTGLDGCIATDQVVLRDNTMKNWGLGVVQNNDPDIVITGSTLPETADAFEWDFGDGTSNATDLNPTHSFTENGTYTITLTVSNECGEESLSTEVNITNICEGPDNTVSQSGNTLTANADNLSYRWLDCNNNNEFIVGQNMQTFTPTESGSYAVEVSDGICVTVSACIQVEIEEDVLSSPDFINETGVLLFPNPVTNMLNINKGGNKQINIQILDINGRQLYSKILTIQQTVIDMTDFQKGVYFVIITNEKGRAIQKISRQN